MDFHICTVGLRSQISALQVDIVENVKFNHVFSLFFAQILLKNDTVGLECMKFEVRIFGGFRGVHSFVLDIEP